jgi:hypothetical protein
VTVPASARTIKQSNDRSAADTSAEQIGEIDLGRALAPQREEQRQEQPGKDVGKRTHQDERKQRVEPAGENHRTEHRHGEGERRPEQRSGKILAREATRQHGGERSAAAQPQHRERNHQECGFRKELQAEDDDLQDLIGQHCA